MSPRSIFATVAVILALAGCAFAGPWPSEHQNQQRYTLKDGSTLVVDADGLMRMFDVYGKPLYMKGGVAMEWKDGTIIAMREDILWRTLRTRGTLNPRS